MIRYAPPLLAVTALAMPAAAEVQVQSSGPLVEMTVTESVAADPDIVDLSAGVTTRAQSAVEAMRQNAQAMNRVIERIEALGIDEPDIQTSGISLHPQYDYDQRSQQQVFRGYQVSNRVSITLREIDRTGEVLDALVAAGATDLGGINWGIDDATAARAQARQAAVANARERAMAYARMAGYSDIRLLEISENLSPGRPPVIETTAARAEDASTPVRPGQVEARVTVRVTYEMSN